MQVQNRSSASRSNRGVNPRQRRRTRRSKGSHHARATNPFSPLPLIEYGKYSLDFEPKSGVYLLLRRHGRGDPEPFKRNWTVIAVKESSDFRSDLSSEYDNLDKTNATHYVDLPGFEDEKFRRLWQQLQPLDKSNRPWGCYEAGSGRNPDTIVSMDKALERVERFTHALKFLAFEIEQRYHCSCKLVDTDTTGETSVQRAIKIVNLDKTDHCGTLLAEYTISYQVIFRLQHNGGLHRKVIRYEAIGDPWEAGRAQLPKLVELAAYCLQLKPRK